MTLKTMQSQLKKKAPKPSFKIVDIYSQDALQKACWNRVEEYTGNPILVDFAAQLISEQNIPERNDLALAEAIQEYSQKHIKFFRERPERFTSPIRTIIWGLGDCDDKTIFIATILRSFRIPVKLGFITYFPFDKKLNKYIKKAHVLPYAKINNEWTALESVHDWPIGKDPIKEFKNKNIKYNVVFIGDN